MLNLFCFQGNVETHVTAVHSNDRLPTINTRVRPIRIAARRQRELMVILAQEELGIEEAEWAKEEDVDLPEGFNENVTLQETPVTIVQLEEHFSSPWENNE